MQRISRERYLKQFPSTINLRLTQQIPNLHRPLLSRYEDVSVVY